MLATGAAAAPALAALHEVVPHEGLHRRSAATPSRRRRADGARRPRRARAGSRCTTASGRASWTSPPTASTRASSCATSTTARRAGSPTAGRCASGRSSPRTRRSRSRPGITYPGLDLQRPHPGPDAALPPRATGCGSASSTAPQHPHTIHFHGIHPDFMDGMPGIGEQRGGGQIETGEQFVYEFDAEPFGLHLYHCHVMPLAAHIAKGLYGAFIIDPRRGPRRRRRAGDGDERLRHRLRRRERHLRRQLDRRSTTSSIRSA